MRWGVTRDIGWMAFPFWARHLRIRNDVRFDDSLRTVLAADASTALGARAAFRQIVDLVTRRRVSPNAVALDRLRELRTVVPEDVRTAAARGFAFTSPPTELVAFFTEDTRPVASATLRVAQLACEDWVALLPRLGPAGRAVLRARTDLDDAVVRGLEAFGTTDFTIGYVNGGTITTPEHTIPAGEGKSIEQDARPDRSDTPGDAEADAPVGKFAIADLVDRLATFQSGQWANDRPTDAEPAAEFRFETDAGGVIRWVDAIPRGAAVGLSIAHGGKDGSVADGVAAGAFRRRTPFSDARLAIAGASALAGDWRISATPLFDPATGRFLGYRGSARRPRYDETIGQVAHTRRTSEGLRRLVHELRTPANAIAGFAELIEREMLGPVSDAYRARAASIRANVTDLVAAIEDLDLAARIEGEALELRPAMVGVAPLVTRVATGLAPLAALRGCEIGPIAIDPAMTLACDDVAVERLFGRLLAALVSASGEGDRVSIAAEIDGAGQVEIVFDRPAALANLPDAALLSLDAERHVDTPGAPLLGTGFALRLARNLAAELGGALVLGAHRLVLRLPAWKGGDLGEASSR